MIEKEFTIKFDSEDKRILIKNVKIFVLLCMVAIMTLIFPDIKFKKDPVTVEFSEVGRICELATLRCYYHNVAEYEKQPDGLFKYGLFQYGYKKFWLEYEGVVEVGIDFDKVQVNEPDKNDIVWIYVPEAKILNVDAVENSLNMISDTGVLTEITVEEEAIVFSEAQATMEKNAVNDSSILNQAKNNAKKLLKEYIVNVGKQIGKEYEVKWLNKPL